MKSNNDDYKFLENFYLNKGSQGFASMNPEKQKEIASKGGRAAHKAGKAHEWNSQEAKIAGRKGGRASRSVDRGE